MTEYLAGRRILVVPDKFKGTTAQRAAEVIAAEARRAGARTSNVAMADGGERTVEAFGRANRSLEVSGPLGRPVRVGWRRAEGVAVIESAAASGLVTAGGSRGNDPVAAQTAGTGELIAEALAEGAQEVIVGMGGSASTDGGRGALSALEAYLPFPPGG
ncbi:MAG: hypothetical protein JWO67_2974 [Streptosporangiaceae bacterium]|nr:hypothetical protein [Streptosporangiaceae bacterium]